MKCFSGKTTLCPRYMNGKTTHAQHTSKQNRKKIITFNGINCGARENEKSDDQCCFISSKFSAFANLLGTCVGERAVPRTRATCMHVYLFDGDNQYYCRCTNNYDTRDLQKFRMN